MFSRNWPGLAPPAEAAAVVSLLTEAVRLVGRMEKARAPSNEGAVNGAAMLLYLASGLSWNFLRRCLTGSAPHNPDYVNVEPVPALLALCGRKPAAEQGTKLEELLREVSGEIRIALRGAWWRSLVPQSFARRWTTAPSTQ